MYNNTYIATFNSLNPCCNGIYLIIIETLEKGDVFMGLNPCCNGIYLIIQKLKSLSSGIPVLILVVMEYT